LKITDELAKKFSTIKFLAFDFDGVFTDNLVYTTEKGEESVACWRSDGLGISKIKKLNIPIWVISTEKNNVVSKRCEKLGLSCIQNCDDKLATLMELLEKHHCDLKNTAFTGNDINDSACLEKVGLPIVVADSHQDIDHLALYRTEKRGGRGAVREVCDLIFKHHNLLNNKHND
jgi:3-deoxy-D-manno-octulosonate 8-phosphate phosphatase (KDO 8-P phosphatase)